jgi:hypothetical protein
MNFSFIREVQDFQPSGNQPHNRSQKQGCEKGKGEKKKPPQRQARKEQLNTI